MNHKMKISRVPSQIALYTILIVSALVIAFPYYWMVITTLKPSDQVYTSDIQLIPKEISLESYRVALSDKQLPIGRFFVNSVIIAVGSTCITVVTATLAAYPLARRHVPGGKIAYFLIVATMMVPGEVVLIGIFMLVNSLKMGNTYQGMIMPLSVNAVIFLVVYNYVTELPKEMDEAALVDGANIWQILWEVIIPLSRPAIYSGALLSFLSAWQNFTIPYLVAQNNSMYPLAVGAILTESTLYITMQETLTVSTILTIPTLLVFILTQRFVFTGITTGAIKG